MAKKKTNHSHFEGNAPNNDVNDVTVTCPPVDYIKDDFPQKKVPPFFTYLNDSSQERMDQNMSVIQRKRVKT